MRWSLLLVVLLPMFAGCQRATYVPQRAGEPYPDHLHLTSFPIDGDRVELRPSVVDIHVFRDDTDLKIVNSTVTGYEGVRLWINQRYMLDVDRLPAGETTVLSLWEFFDMWGQRFNAGGFWRANEPDPVRLVEIQLDEDSPLVGLIAIRSEPPAEE